MDSERSRLNEVNMQLMKLGVPPTQIEIKRGEIFTRFLEEARIKGIYKEPAEVRI